MTFTYTATPNTSDRDAVRFLIQDTDETDALVLDEEITFALAEEGNNYLAAGLCARTLAAKFASKAKRQIGDLRIEYLDTSIMWRNRGADLEARGQRSGGAPYVGGISRADKESVRDDTDRVVPTFRKGMHDNPPTFNPDDPKLSNQ